MRLLQRAALDDLNVLHSVEHGEGSNGCSVAPKLAGVDHLWDDVVRQEPFEKGLRCPCIPLILQEKIQHRAAFVDGSPQPEFLATDLDAHLIQKPPGTPPLFPVAQLFGQERGELDIPLTQGLVTDVNAALLEQFLNITLAQRKAVIQPKSVLNDAQREGGGGRACDQSRTLSRLWQVVGVG
ncbi:hypothetical protein HNQ08_005569 [Deinococcus humi]|uniref:Uncharacterized protein n=1 Tax=Deinococcus humi TaxID=662880 RepID=A0A7W8K067_9DEIO|nr:hypothetical protein [Deinococcus humi]